LHFSEEKKKKNRKEKEKPQVHFIRSVVVLALFLEKQGVGPKAVPCSKENTFCSKRTHSIVREHGRVLLLF